MFIIYLVTTTKFENHAFIILWLYCSIFNYLTGFFSPLLTCLYMLICIWHHLFCCPRPKHYCINCSDSTSSWNLSITYSESSTFRRIGVVMSYIGIGVCVSLSVDVRCLCRCIVAIWYFGETSGKKNSDNTA